MERRRLIGVVGCAVAGGLVFLAAEAFYRPTGCSLPADPFGAQREELQEAKLLVGQQRWAEALDRFTRLQRLYPSYSPESVRQYRELCAREVEVSESLALARRLLLQEQYVAARRVLSQIPNSSPQVIARDELRMQLSSSAKAILYEAEKLAGAKGDREQLLRMRELAAEAAELGYARGQELRDQADDALRELDEPWIAALAAFDAGDVGLALTKAKACAKAHAECRELVAPLSKLAPQMGKLGTLSIPKLLELFAVAGEVSDGQPQELIAGVLGQRYEARATRCRDDENWQCVSRDLLLARDLDRRFEDDTIEDELNEYARNEILRAEQLRLSKSSQARPTIERVLRLHAIQSQSMLLAQRLKVDLLAGK